MEQSQQQKRDQENRLYLQNEVNDILEPLMLENVRQKPENQVSVPAPVDPLCL